jgi:hypothetical protein
MKAFVSKLNRQLFMILLLSVAVTTGSHAKHGVKRIHMKIVSAPVVANGTVAGEPTEFNLLLHRDGVPAHKAMDPEVFGLQIPAGGRMDVELGGSFIPNPGFSEADDTLPLFKPARNIIITTGPQNPVKPNTEEVSGGFWGVSFDQAANPNLVSIFPRCGTEVACQNLDADYPGGLNGTRARALGFKVIHIRPNDRGQKHETTPFYNGPAGSIGTVYVRIYNADNSLVAAGSDRIVFRRQVGTQVHLTNSATRDDNSVVSLTNFQHVASGTVMDGTSIPEGGSFADGAPYAPQFLLFENFGKHDRDQFPTGDDLPGPGDESFIPFPGIDGVTVVPSHRNPRFARLVQYGTKTVGRVVMMGPWKRSGAVILGNDIPTTASDTANGSRLFVPVKVGKVPGHYRVIVHMNGGGTAVNTIVVD